VDGEGVTFADGRHVYTYLAAVDETGHVWGEAYSKNGLSHGQMLNMLLDLPPDSLKFGYMFSYDLTKILEELPVPDRYMVAHHESRRRRKCLKCHKHWQTLKSGCACGSLEFCTATETWLYNGRGYDFRPGHVTFYDQRNPMSKQWGRKCQIWDCFKFFQGAFVEALQNWDIGTPEQRKRILDMKLQRGSFIENDPAEVRRYCREECELLGQMMRKLINAHLEAGIDLDGQYQGAGATANALLKKYSVELYKTEDFSKHPPQFQHAVMSAYFGGRFENSQIGLIERPIYGYDIASAYPYAETFLPCLRCGAWRHVAGSDTLRAVKRGRLAVCHFHVGQVSTREREEIAWMPLPFRDSKGSICYPTNCEGWAWREEILAALAGWGDLIRVSEAWVYECDCDHQPFGFLPGVYKQRIAWGKEGKGIVLKLGSNACCGKTAQHVGAQLYQDWIWAGNTTSQTRAQISQLIGQSKNRWSVLSTATDGIYSYVPLNCPEPRDTGTFGLIDGAGKPKMALGGWERKDVPTGVFLAKPGLYYALDPKLDQKDVRARGVGRRDVFAQKQELIDGFLAWDRKDLDYSVKLNTRRFFGLKHSLRCFSKCQKCHTHWSGTHRDGCPSCGQMGDGVHFTSVQHDGQEVYGRWFDLQTDVKFDPNPKRERKMRSGGRFAHMHVRDMGGQVSAPYGKTPLSPEAEESKLTKELAYEQPDTCLTDDFEVA